MNCKVEKSSIDGKITCPSNKSYTHRAIFMASLADGKSMIKNILKSGDTIATINVCKNFGVEIKEEKNNLIVDSPNELKLQDSIIDAANSGTTIRIAAAISALADTKIVLSGDQSLNKRPMQPLLKALESLGAKCSSSNGTPPISILGKIKGGEVKIPGNISSQFISALMIVAPKLENGMLLNIQGELVSKPYIDATIMAMKEFAVNVETVIPYQQLQQ